MIFVFPVRLTPMRTSLSLSRTAHFGAANSTRAGWTLPAVKNRNTTFTHPFDCISGSSFLLLSVSKRTKRLLVFMRLFSSIPKALKSESELRDLLVLRAQCKLICVIRILLRSIEIIKMGYWPSVGSRWLDIGHSSLFAGLWTETQLKSMKLPKNRTKPISSHLNRAILVNKGFMTWLSGKFFFRNTAGSPEGAR